MMHGWVRKSAIAAVCLLSYLAVSVPAKAEEPQSIAATQFERMATLTGEWNAQNHPSLRILFELTAGGTVVVERWMLGERLHSMTVYHLDGETLMATHYCPQGNQPRLKIESGSNKNHISFSFFDATNLESLEQSHQHRLSFDFSNADYVTRGEAYSQGASSDQTEMVLVRAR